jgi:quinol monooxygenase YgiN
MISFTVRMEFQAKDRDAVAEILRHLGAASRQEPGCVNYIAHFVEGEPATVLIYEQYCNEAALDHHRNSPHFEQYATGGLYKIVQARTLENLSVVD